MTCSGNVINKLTEGDRNAHIPYRDSKLTRILQPALGGNSKTAVICNITPSVLHVDETHGTLRFACRTKRVTNRAQVNEVLNDDALLKRQAKEIEKLKGMLQESNAGEIAQEVQSFRKTGGKGKRELSLLLRGILDHMLFFCYYCCCYCYIFQVSKLRNALLEKDSENLRISTMLEEEQESKRLQQKRMAEQEQKIHNLQNLVLKSTATIDEEDYPNRSKR